MRRTTATIAGERVVPFLTEGREGFSIDYPRRTGSRAERHAARACSDAAVTA